MNAAADRLQNVESRIAEACSQAGRQRADVTLVAVSKRHTPARIRELYALGVRDFGESYAQELRDKRAELPDDIRWHFIGGLQSNKVPYIMGAALIHTVDRRSLVNAIAKRAQSARQDILLQVNLADEVQKAGCAVDDAPGLVDAIVAHPALRLRGLMNITPLLGDADAVRGEFAKLRGLKERLVARIPANDRAMFDTLSMGMSGDLEEAILEGATHVRVGTALFGPRI